jgi:NADH:ubiquinone oxidoreductase subunit 4 (subunit M)
MVGLEGLVLIGCFRVVLLVGWRNGLVLLDEVRFWFLFMHLLVHCVIFLVSFHLAFVLLLFGIAFCFLRGDLLSFFVCFEFIMLPMVIYICVGKTGERYLAGFYLVLYTFVFSIPSFVGFVYLYSSGVMYRFCCLDLVRVRLLWLCVVAVITFSVKFPVYLLHS